ILGRLHLPGALQVACSERVVQHVCRAQLVPPPQEPGGSLTMIVTMIFRSESFLLHAEGWEVFSAPHLQQCIHVYVCPICGDAWGHSGPELDDVRYLPSTRCCREHGDGSP